MKLAVSFKYINESVKNITPTNPLSVSLNEYLYWCLIGCAVNKTECVGGANVWLHFFRYLQPQSFLCHFHAESKANRPKLNPTECIYTLYILAQIVRKRNLIFRALVMFGRGRAGMFVRQIANEVN